MQLAPFWNRPRAWLALAFLSLFACALPAHRGMAEEGAAATPSLEEASPSFRDPSLETRELSPAPARPTRRLRFGTATDRLLRRTYEDLGRRTFYCDCPFDEAKRVDPDPCGFLPGERWARRAERVEWEHVVPASRMLAGRPCATDPERKRSPREHCRRTDPEFRMMEADLHNLVPSIGQLNAERSNFPYGIVPGELRRFGECDFEVEDGIVEPAPDIRGDIARITLYMASVYGLTLSDDERDTLEQWALADPPTRIEVEIWNRKYRELRAKARWRPRRF